MGFKLKVITPNGEFYNGEVKQITITTAMGVIGVLPRHIPLVAPVEISKLHIHVEGEVRECAIAGGVLYVEEDQTRILTNACEGKHEIDITRAEAAAERARTRLASQKENIDILRAEAALKRALNRISVAQNNQ